MLIVSIYGEYAKVWTQTYLVNCGILMREGGESVNAMKMIYITASQDAAVVRFNKAVRGKDIGDARHHTVPQTKTGRIAPAQNNSGGGGGARARFVRCWYSSVSEFANGAATTKSKQLAPEFTNGLLQDCSLSDVVSVFSVPFTEVPVLCYTNL